MADDVLACRDLHKRFGDRTAVDGVGFDIARGETYGLLGPNGAGKTTTISMICGLLDRDEGSVTVAGHDLDREPLRVRAAIGYVPQDLAIYPDLSGRENLSFFGQLQGLRGAELSSRVDEVLEIVGLTDRAGERSDTYSGGMKRRLNIGIGLLHRPALLVLDEPTVGVDPQSRNAILEAVSQLGAEGMGVLYTTHYMEEAERLCDRVGIIDEGRIQASGTRRELIDVIGEMDRAHLVVDGDRDVVGAELATVPAVRSVTATPDGFDLTLVDGHAHIAAVLGCVDGAGGRVRGVELVEPDLEAVFLHLTGRQLRD